MSLFTVRLTEENGNVVAWIDKDNQPCIMQPHAPDQPEGSVWSSTEEALAWANNHAAQLEQLEIDFQAQAAAKADAQASAHAKLIALGLTPEEIAAL